MGRTIPSATELIFQQVKDAQPLYDTLRLQDQIKMDEMFDMVMQHTAPLQNTGSLTPLEFTLVLMVLEVFKSVDYLRHEVYEEMREMWEKFAPQEDLEIIDGIFTELLEADETIPGLVP